MEHYIEYLKAAFAAVQHDAATFYANWKKTEANLAEAHERISMLNERIAQLTSADEPPAQ